jgi:glycosyltransferase involved in cell wall biosynthesis
MRLDVDLGFDAVPGRKLASGEAVTLDLDRVAASLRTPARLLRLLRERRYEELRIREGSLPLSTVQAAALVSLGAARTNRFVVRERVLGRGRFLAYAFARAAFAVPSELLRSAFLAIRVERAASSSYELADLAQEPRSALYLRVDPTLRWFGVQIGGAATHTSGVINGLLDNGIAVDVLAAERPNDTERATHVEVPARRIFQLVRGLTYTDYSNALLEAAGTTREVDFVYQRYQLGSYAGLELAQRLRVPLVLEFNGSEIWVERNWGSGRMRLGQSLERLEVRNLHDASLVVVVSEPLRRQVLSLGAPPERVLVNPNGVDVGALARYRRHAPAEWRFRLGLPQGPAVGFIGTFGLWHGVKLLPALIAAVPDARWIVVGDGGLMGEVRAEIEARQLLDRVLLTGVVEHRRALELMACCDVCVSPHIPNLDGTPFFGSPTKLFEYMGLAKPIVASELGQIGEVIETEQSGLLCPPGNVEAAASAVRRLLGDEELCGRLGAGALELATTKYSWEAHARRILDALQVGCEPTGGDSPVA